MYKDRRKILGDKSMICFGSRCKWIKLANSLNLNIDHVELQMDEIIKLKEEDKTKPNSPQIKMNRKNRRTIKAIKRKEKK